MLHKTPNRETNSSSPQNQPERRRQDRRRERQPEGWPSDKRRKDQRREDIQMAQRESAHETGEGTARYSNPTSGTEFSPGGRERGFGPQNPQKRQERESGNFGVTHDSGFGQNPGEQGDGGKTDSSQRDMGETGQRK
jgi:hypothetical protein